MIENLAGRSGGPDGEMSFVPEQDVTLVDRLLAEQRTLTAVERFAQRHEAGHAPRQARYYEDLIPFTKPAVGEQYAFAVDLDKCTGCKACVSACHSLNGLEENETWRDTGLLIGGHEGISYQQTVTTACHHCIEPGCLEGCPVMAYEKDADTGVVRHLDDQCIGCQYCTMKCPYGVPKYSNRLGIVRKCDMCHERLAVGEAPACVQACPHEAITIRLVDIAEVSAAATPGTRMLPGAFDSDYTKPTTLFHSRKSPPANATAADARHLQLEHAHWPLIAMLILSQLTVGVLIVLGIAGLASREQFRLSAFPLSMFAFLALNAGLAASIFHLGRPLGAWRFFLGLRTSWMSREIFAFGMLAGSTAFAVVLSGLMPDSVLALTAVCASSALGAVAVFASAMIYVDTRRAFWRGSLTFVRFFGATFLLGTSGTAAAMGWINAGHSVGASSTVAACVLGSMILRAALFAWETRGYVRARRDPHDSIHRSAQTVRRLLPWIPPAQAGLFTAAMGLSMMAILDGESAGAWACASFVATLISGTLERFTFFTAVDAPRMPGKL